MIVCCMDFGTSVGTPPECIHESELLLDCTVAYQCKTYSSGYAFLVVLHLFRQLGSDMCDNAYAISDVAETATNHRRGYRMLRTSGMCFPHL